MLTLESELWTLVDLDKGQDHNVDLTCYGLEYHDAAIRMIGMALDTREDCSGLFVFRYYTGKIEAYCFSQAEDQHYLGRIIASVKIP